MAEAIIFLTVSLSVFLIFTEVITLDILYSDETVVEIGLTIFAIQFTKNKKQKQKSPKKRKKRRGAADIYPFITALIPRSEISIREISFGIRARDPAEYALKRGASILIVSSMLAYAEENAKKFSFSNIKLTFSEHNNSDITVNAQIRISLTDILIALASRIVWQKNMSRRIYGRK